VACLDLPDRQEHRDLPERVEHRVKQGLLGHQVHQDLSAIPASRDSRGQVVTPVCKVPQGHPGLLGALEQRDRTARLDHPDHGDQQGLLERRDHLEAVDRRVLLGLSG